MSRYCRFALWMDCQQIRQSNDDILLKAEMLDLVKQYGTQKHSFGIIDLWNNDFIIFL